MPDFSLPRGSETHKLTRMNCTALCMCAGLLSVCLLYTSLLLRKPYADGTHEDTTYNALNLRSTLTDARCVVTTWGYNLKKGVNTSVSYSDSTPGIQYAYNYPLSYNSSFIFGSFSGKFPLIGKSVLGKLSVLP